MSHPIERGSYIKAINTQILRDIEQARIRQLRRAHWSEQTRGQQSPVKRITWISILAAILLMVWI